VKSMQSWSNPCKYAAGRPNCAIQNFAKGIEQRFQEKQHASEDSHVLLNVVCVFDRAGR